MSKFSWRNGFAVGLTIGIFGVLIVGLLFETYPSEGTQPSADRQEGQNNHPTDYRWWLIPKTLFMEDSAAQWLMVILTFAAVVMVYWTLKDTRRMLFDTREIGQAQVRAHLHLEIVDVNIQAVEINGVDRVRTRFTGKVRNTGNSPAHRMRLNYDIFQSNVGEVINVNTSGSGLATEVKSLSAIPPGGDVSVELKRTFTADLGALSEQRAYVGLSYVIKCIDVFNIEVFEPLVSGAFKEHPANSGRYVFAQHSIVDNAEASDQS